jgi:cobalt transporter subunit CbtB
MDTTRTAAAPALPQTVAQAVMPVTVSVLLGVFVLLGVGFAGSTTIHNAAHDTRHAFAFPCH